MPLYGEFVDARAVAPEKSRIIQLSRSINHLVGVTPVRVIRPVGTRILTVRCESGTIRIKPDDYRGKSFPAQDVFASPDEFESTAHGYIDGMGPYQLVVNQAVMVPLTSIVIGTDDTFTRTVGSWLDDGFQLTGGATFTLTGSASNDGTFTISGLSALVMTVSEDITDAEIAQTDLVILGPPVIPGDLSELTDYWTIDASVNRFQIATSLANALAGVPHLFSSKGQGLMNFGGPPGWGANAVAAATVSDGYGSLAVTAGNEVSFAAPEEITLVGMTASDACSYWWGE